MLQFDDEMRLHTKLCPTSLLSKLPQIGQVALDTSNTPTIIHQRIEDRSITLFKQDASHQVIREEIGEGLRMALGDEG